ncbi:MAG TPA: excinuclease ABC subunit UvrA [Thermoanaerobaculia bacterium]|nr:excinuclease ABC subunit UvrA [Thermoanaerobaculia bacterium]
MSTPATPPRSLLLTGARTHNLKGISCAIPHGQVTVVTGPSGAGKSSLVFDTLFAEGQRRFVESMSTYAQQFIQQLERPPLDSLEHLLPAVALQAGNPIRNARATVGTLTEAHDLLRLLFTYLGEVQCANGCGPTRAFTSESAAAALAAGLAGPDFLLVAPLARPRDRADDKLQELVRQGYFRLWRDGEIVRVSPGDPWPADADPLPLLLGRFRAAAADSRLGDAVEESFRLARGRLLAVPTAGGATAKPVQLAEELGCPVCGEAARRPVAALFSFNSPLGACAECSGFGRIIGIDRRRVVPDPGKSLRERPFAPWNTPSYEEHYAPLLAACKQAGVPLDVPWRDLSPEAREWIWSGPDGAAPRRRWRRPRTFLGLSAFFAWLETRTYRVHVRVLLARYRAYHPCPTCGGARLQPEALRVRLRDRTLPDLLALSIEELRRWLAQQQWSDAERARGDHLFESLARRLEVLHQVGLDYLTLDRSGRTLSGGEAQRIQLAAALGSGLTGTLYALDEPTIGLHARDSRRLLALLHDLSARGNTVVVVEHDPAVIRGADFLLELGPGAGEAGGNLVFSGTPHELLRTADTLTARHLRRSGAHLARRHVARRRQERGVTRPEQQFANRPWVEIVGASAHNLCDVDVRFPLGALVAVTGVSGSGKSTLVESVLYEGARALRGELDAEPGACRELRGIDALAEVLLVDQRPLGRSSRSNPVTAIGAYDELRKLFAGSPEAIAHGLGPGHFSFNLDLGRCPDCRGTGTQEVDLQFLGTMEVVCERCQGRRFRPEVLAVRVRGKNLAETLEMTIDQALAELGDQRGLARKLRLLEQAGLGYLRLGQPTSTLSAGEAQRLKLAAFLREAPAGRKEGGRGRGGGLRGSRRLLLFDEPTTGLHLSDIALLYRSLRRLVQRGDGVVVVEHQLDLIARADWIVELGPGGGAHGGRVLWCGPLQGFLEEGEGPTAEELRGHLDWEPRRRVAGRRPPVLAEAPGERVASG